MKRFAKNVLLPLVRNTVVAASLLIGLVGTLTFLTQHSRASQASCVMPTNGTVSGLTLVNDINACNQSLISVWSGGSAPPSPVAGMLWFNTNTNFVQQYDGSTWNNLWFVDATNHLTVAPIGGGTVGSTVAAAATTNIAALPQTYVSITGTASITSFGSSAPVGTIRIVGFSSSGSTLVQGSSLLLPNATSITTTAGDVLTAFYFGGGIWQVLSYSYFSAIPTKASPTTSDFVQITDTAAGNAPKRSLISSLLALVGVTAIDSQVGAFTTGGGIDSVSKVIELTAARRTLPLSQVFTSGTNVTYTTPAGALWLEVNVISGGGGGGGGQNAAGGTSGTQSCWGASGSACGTAIFLANGGGGGSKDLPGAGGTAGLSNTSWSIYGNGGSPPVVNAGPGFNGVGGTGGGSCRGGGAIGSSGSSTASSAGVNTGGGGGGGGATNATLTGSTGGGGGGGGCVMGSINSPAASYVYTVGAGGGGASGSSSGASAGGTGGNGGDGRIEVIAHFGS